MKPRRAPYFRLFQNITPLRGIWSR